MSRVVAISALATGVRSYFAARGITANVIVGWKAATSRINEGPGGANRVVFIPSDPNGRGGKITIGTHTRHTPHVIATWEQNITVAVWAADTSSQNALADEEKQIAAVTTLFEDTMQAVRATAHAAAVWGDTAWVLDPLEHAFGRELRASLLLKSEFFDRDYATRTPGPLLTKTIV